MQPTNRKMVRVYSFAYEKKQKKECLGDDIQTFQLSDWELFLYGDWKNIRTQLSVYRAHNGHCCGHQRRQSKRTISIAISQMMAFFIAIQNKAESKNSHYRV